MGWTKHWEKVPKRALAIMCFASNNLHNHEGKKLSCPSQNTKNFEQIHWNQIFCWMYGLAMMLSISRLTTSKNIDEIKTAHCATSLFSLPKIRKVSPFPLLLPFFAVLKRQLSRHRQSDWLDWLGLFWPILLVVQANPLIRAQSTMVGFALNGYWQGFWL